MAGARVHAHEFFVETALVVRKRVYGGVDVYGTLAYYRSSWWMKMKRITSGELEV